MNKKILVALLCFAIFLSAVGVGIATHVSQSSSKIQQTMRVQEKQGPIITPVEGDPIGGGRRWIFH